jgi:ribokinase
LAADEARVRSAQFVLLQLELPPETVGAAVHMVKRHGARVILDPAPAPAALPRTRLQQVDILTPNETEATQLVGKPPGELSVDEARTIARHLQATGAKSVVIKLGAQGCLLLEADVPTLIPAPAVDAVDTTAAGDVFNGALAVACTEGASLSDACQFAVRAASLSVRRLGAQCSMPSRAELSG